MNAESARRVLVIEDDPVSSAWVIDEENKQLTSGRAKGICESRALTNERNRVPASQRFEVRRPKVGARRL